MSARPREPHTRHAAARAFRAMSAAALGIAAALLMSCSSSGNGLIPAASAGPLRGDFEAVVRAAEGGNGKCAETEAAISKTELDFAALPASVDAGLRNSLRGGIDNLKRVARKLCEQPVPQATNTSTTTQAPPPTKTATTPSTPTTNTQTTPPPNTGTTTSPGGGTPPEESKGNGVEPGGAGGGTEEPGGRSGGQEAGK